MLKHTIIHSKISVSEFCTKEIPTWKLEKKVLKQLIVAHAFPRTFVQAISKLLFQIWQAII